MSEESVVIVCPNPKCRREIEEPILLTVLSVTPPEQYEACPYCFTQLEPEPPTEQEAAPEPMTEKKKVEENLPANTVLEKVIDSAPRFLQKVKDLIPNSNGSQKEKSEKPEKPRVESTGKKEEEKPAKREPEAEPVDKEPEEAPRTEQIDKEESETSGCPEHFGYLANRPPDATIPPQCLVCPKMVDCVLSPKES